MKDESLINYYDLLNIGLTASLDEINKNYRKMAIKYHPDKNPYIDTTFKMQQLNTAKEILIDKKSRKEYDNFLFNSALQNGDIKVIYFFLNSKSPYFNVNAKSNNGDIPLHDACIFGFLEIAELLIENGAAVNAKNNIGNTPLHYVIEHNAKLKLINLLIENGAAINAKNHDGNTALHIACIFGFLEVTELLIENGAAVNAKNNIGNTPLHCVIKNNANIKLINLLIENGANIKIKNGKKLNSLGIAQDIKNEKIYNLLLQTLQQQQIEKKEQSLSNMNTTINNIEKNINDIKKNIADFEQKKINSFLNFIIKIFSFGCINKNKKINEEILIKNNQVKNLLAQKTTINNKKQLLQEKITNLKFSKIVNVNTDQWSNQPPTSGYQRSNSSHM